MDVISPDSRDRFRRKQISEIRKRIRQSYADRLKKAATREAKKTIKQEMEKEIAASIAPLLEEAKNESGHILGVLGSSSIRRRSKPDLGE